MLKKILTRLGLTGAFVAATMAPVSAEAAPPPVWQCYVWYGGNPAYWASARCDYGLGGVRVVGYCWNGSYDELYYGPWKPAGQTSTMICNGGKTLDGAWYETW